MDEEAYLEFAGKITGPELQTIWDYVDKKLLAGLQVVLNIGFRDLFIKYFNFEMSIHPSYKKNISQSQKPS